VEVRLILIEEDTEFGEEAFGDPDAGCWINIDIG
jgi:hypothetical protein